jgi:hypothetical protein
MSRNPILVAGIAKSLVINAENTLIEQLSNAFPADAKIPINGELMTIPQIVTLLKNSKTALQTAEALKAQAHTAVVDSDTQLAAVRAVVLDLQNYAVLTLGRTSDKLALLGFAAPKKGVKTPETLVVAAAKGKATREARGTKGKNQKKGIHGAVPAEAPAVKKG